MRFIVVISRSRGVVRGIVATVNSNTPSVPRPDDLPPSYDELFPPDVVVEPRTPHQYPAPPYSPEEQKPPEESKDEKGEKSTAE